MSYSFVKSAITGNTLREWKEHGDENPRKYWGRYYLRHPAFRRYKHTGSFPLKRAGGGPTLTARLIRTAHRQYRDRFRRQ